MFRSRLLELRNRSGLTQEEFALLIKIPRSTYSNHESGKREPDYETLQIYANHYKVSVDHILYRDIQEVPSEHDSEFKTISDKVDWELQNWYSHLPESEQKFFKEFVKAKYLEVKRDKK